LDHSSVTVLYCLSTTPLRYLPSSPTRRSSDLHTLPHTARRELHSSRSCLRLNRESSGSPLLRSRRPRERTSVDFPWHGSDSRDSDRKSTRLNSSHVKISSAVFFLHKKKHMSCY